jgi:hypothetical protein
MTMITLPNGASTLFCHQSQSRTNYILVLKYIKDYSSSTCTCIYTFYVFSSIKPWPPRWWRWFLTFPIYMKILLLAEEVRAHFLLSFIKWWKTLLIKGTAKSLVCGLAIRLNALHITHNVYSMRYCVHCTLHITYTVCVTACIAHYT